MLAHIALWAATVVFCAMTWASFEIAGQRLENPEPGGAPYVFYRWVGVAFLALALICARAS